MVEVVRKQRCGGSAPSSVFAPFRRRSASSSWAVRWATTASASRILRSSVSRALVASTSFSCAFTASVNRGRNMISPSCETDFTVTTAAAITPMVAAMRRASERWVRMDTASGTRLNSMTA